MSTFKRLVSAVLSCTWRVALCFVVAPGAEAGELDLTGSIAGELRIFPAGPADAYQDDAIFSPSFTIEPEVVYEWNNDKDRLTMKPFLRLDAHDENRTHFDLREVNWLHIGDSWDLRVGLGKVFWGVTESYHLIDIINQTDLVEDLDGEDKLGQPMVNLTIQRNWGSLALFVLPGFRERTFPDAEARLRGSLPIDTDNATYDSGAGPGHVDLAVRWSRAIGNWDLGLSHFYGISREPEYRIAVNPSDQPKLVPHYSLINQTALDVQLTTGAWLWKLEAMTRSGHGDRFFAAVGGFEYTISQVARSNADLGLLAEFLYDGRDTKAPPTLADNDLFFGARLGLNDIQDTSILGGAIVDLKSHASVLFLEAERRLGNRWKLELETRLVLAGPEDSILFGIRDDDYLTIRLARYF